MYCVNLNKDAKAHFAFFFIFFLLSLLHVYNTYRHFLVFFSSKDFSATTWVRILKFGTKLESDELYCVTKNSHILLISPFIYSLFILSNENLCRKFLRSYWSQCFQILCTPSDRLSVLCK